MTDIPRREGFPGQELFSFSEIVKNSLRNDPVTRDFYVSDIGYYPEARGHMVLRPEGRGEGIFIFCTNAEGFCSYASFDSFVRSGEAVIIPPNVPHRYGSSPREQSSTGGWQICWFHFSGEQAEKIGERWGGRILRQAAARVVPWREAFCELLWPLRNSYSLSFPGRLSCQIKGLLGEFLYPSPGGTDRPGGSVDRTIDFIHRNLHRPLKLEDLCQIANLSVSRLSELFSAQTGLSPIDYTLHQKIQRSCHLLDHTGQSVKEIAPALGFRDPYYFSRLFKKIMGVSPTHYRGRFHP